jgi:hypothetical protein
MKITEYKGRKDYKCDLCLENIREGEKYRLIVTEKSDWIDWDPDINPRQTFRRHIECDKAQEILVDFFGDESYCHFYDRGAHDEIIDFLNDGFNEENGFELIKYYLPNEQYQLVVKFLLLLGISEPINFEKLSGGKDSTLSAPWRWKNEM